MGLALIRRIRVNLPSCWMIVMMFFSWGVSYAHPGALVYRDVWFPMYEGERLAYCAENDTNCGKSVANHYCHDMGYAGAQAERVEHNVGRVNYWGSKTQCTGWQCDGFLFITCVEKRPEKPVPPYAYRSKVFAFPRMNHYRVDWCYKKGQACGERAAYSFCRRLGYSKASAYQQEARLAATRTLGDSTLCFGKACDGFESITCYR
jgi:hypothetical protein